MSYKPPQRDIDCTVMTTAGLITAQVAVAEKGTVLEQLDSVPEFYKLTNASIVGVETTVDFLALQRDSVVFWVPKGEPDDRLHQPIKPAQRGRVYVLFRGGAIAGDLVWREGVRLSDFVTRQNGYIVLRDCTIALGHVRTEAPDVRKTRAVVMNVNHIVGISDDDPA